MPPFEGIRVQNREEAIQWLTERGYVAFARDWAMGESTAITKREVESEIGIPTFKPTLIYVCPDRKGGWLVCPPMTGTKDIPFGALPHAVARALEFLESWEDIHSQPPKEFLRRLKWLCREENCDATSPPATDPTTDRSHQSALD
ncbi:MAG TPA: hypothetical protein VGH74_21950 [Planctomycetaceae bacterium]